MCGRYELNLSGSDKGKQIRERAEKLNLVYKEGEIFPSDDVLCVIPVESKIDLTVMKWGIKKKSFQINARMESINDRPSYQDIRDRRCAVVCTGFYEWDKDKNRYHVSTDDEVIYLGCIFNENKELLIITEAADEQFEGIHERKPLIMNQEEMLRFIHNEDGLIKDKKLTFTSMNEISLL